MEGLEERTFQTQTAAPVFANLGSGRQTPERIRRLFPGWRELRVDVDPGVEPDLVADLVDLSAIPSGTVQGVWASHCLEHLFRHEVNQALCEILRILAPDGFACLLVPDLQIIAAHVAEDRLDTEIYTAPAGPVTPHDVLFGFGAAIAEGHRFMAHRCGFTPSSLATVVGACGVGQFVVLRRPNFELACVIQKSGWASEADRDQLIRRLRL